MHFLGISWMEWFGYLASVVVAVSLMMSSIIKLRWLNLGGSLLFSSYGFLIGALPVALLNLFIVLVNIYYLLQLYRQKTDFRIMSLAGDDEFLTYYLDCHRQDISKYFPHFQFSTNSVQQAFYLVKNTVPIGILVSAAPPPAPCP